jgi:hypothetical protein
MRLAAIDDAKSLETGRRKAMGAFLVAGALGLDGAPAQASADWSIDLQGWKVAKKIDSK